MAACGRVRIERACELLRKGQCDCKSLGNSADLKAAPISFQAFHRCCGIDTKGICEKSEGGSRSWRKNRKRTGSPAFSESKNKAYRRIGFRKINGEIAAQYGFITQKRDDFLLQNQGFFSILKKIKKIFRKSIDKIELCAYNNNYSAGRWG